jgi:hypothetical protein
MGNRAVVTVKGSSTGVYLHWNGGKESVNGFLRAAKDLGVRAPSGDTSYFYARFIQIVGNFFGGALSVGVDSLDNLDTDNGDNGTFIVDSNFKIIEHRHSRSREYDQAYEDNVYKMAMEANESIFRRKSE